MERPIRTFEAYNGELPVPYEEFCRFCSEYLPGAKIRILLSDAQGQVAASAGVCDCSCEEMAEHRVFAAESALRWGEPVICDPVAGHLLWAVPLMHNSLLLGGIVVCADEDDLFPDSGEGHFDLKQACDTLLEMAVTYNFCNAALLEQTRLKHHHERKRAEAIHDSKKVNPADILQMYMQEEPELLRMVRSGRRADAVEIINRLLVFIYSHAHRDLSLVKSLLLEMLSSMNRAAVQGGADPEELFSKNFAYFSKLGEIEGEEELSAWVRQALEQVMLSMSKTLADEKGQLLVQITDRLAESCGEHISRDDIADEFDLSPTALSRLLKEQAGCGFSQLLARVRVGQASKLLANTDMPLIKIAYDCGFTDQSYFTRIFNQHTGSTPREYRLRYNPGAC